MSNSHAGEACVSVILVTDTYETARGVIESLERQTIAKQIEVVLVTASPDELRLQTGDIAAFHSVRIETTQSIVFLGGARGIGVRAATAPIVFIAETHAYPDPDLAATLIGVLSGSWSVAVPGFRNANPEFALSWAAFLSDYGAWSAYLPAGATDRAPSHDVAFRRSVLLEFGDRLEHALTFGDELYLGLRARGHRSYFEPAAGIQHVNLYRFASWARERFLAGVLIGGYRSARWTWRRRLVYACAAPLIPIVILARIQRGVRDTWRQQRLPPGTIPGIVLGAVLKAAGEFRGYILGASDSAEAGMTGYEVRKLAFNSGKAR